MSSNSLNLSLHKKQMSVFSSPAQVKVVCAGRGFRQIHAAFVQRHLFLSEL